jgi:hypothetical protein
MGQTRLDQYQQWLLYQAIDRRLRSELEALETELAQLREHIQRLEQAAPQADNLIIRALVNTLNGHEPGANGDTAHPNEPVPAPTTESTSDSSTATISPELANWGGLPNFGPPEMQTPPQNQGVPLTTIPHVDMALLPKDEDMAVFFDEHGKTDPQIELPWWLRNIALAASANNINRTGPTDRETLRTNRLVQRWLERWGRKPVTQDLPLEENMHE